MAAAGRTDPLDSEKFSRQEFYENLAKGVQDSPISYEGEKDVLNQIDSLEKEAYDQTDIRKRLEISKKLIQMKAELELKKIKIANKLVKKHILAVVKETSIKQGVYNEEEQK
jgi:uncharacterized membrane protein